MINRFTKAKRKYIFIHWVIQLWNSLSMDPVMLIRIEDFKRGLATSLGDEMETLLWKLLLECSIRRRPSLLHPICWVSQVICWLMHEKVCQANLTWQDSYAFMSHSERITVPRFELCTIDPRQKLEPSYHTRISSNFMKTIPPVFKSLTNWMWTLISFKVWKKITAILSNKEISHYVTFRK